MDYLMPKPSLQKLASTLTIKPQGLPRVETRDYEENGELWLIWLFFYGVSTLLGLFNAKASFFKQLYDFKWLSGTTTTR